MQATTKSPPAGTMPARPRKERSENAARRRGQLIAKSGTSGGISQPKLHFELRQGSKPVDPLPYLAR